MRLLLALSLFAASPALASSPECMGGDGEGWLSLEVSAPMKPGYCPAVLELPVGLQALRYQLTGQPTLLPAKTICSWSWVAGSGGTLAPRYVHIICTLAH